MNLSGQNVVIEASIPYVQVVGRYNVSSYVAFVSLEGADSLTLNTTGLKIAVKVHFYNNGSTVRISKIDAKAGVSEPLLFTRRPDILSVGRECLHVCRLLFSHQIKASHRKARSI